MKTIVLKVDVDTYRGTREGVPRLLEVFEDFGISATFLFSLGPDHTGWALRRIFRPGFFKKVQRTSVMKHYGLKTLLYGVLLPAPDIGRTCAPLLRKVHEAGHEVGIHAYDHVYWQDHVSQKGGDWTEQQLNLAFERFREIFGFEAKTHGAAGWQMNPHALRWMERFPYASDCRGESPFYPIQEGKSLSCLQLPTTLPTMDELLGLDGVHESNVAQRLLKWTEQEKPYGHVFTLHAELEGNLLAPAFFEFLKGLKAQGYEFLTMEKYFARVRTIVERMGEKGRFAVVDNEISGRSGLVACQATAARTTS